MFHLHHFHFQSFPFFFGLIVLYISWNYNPLIFFKTLSFINGENSDVEEDNNSGNSDVEEGK